jgi:hypothetical protein
MRQSLIFGITAILLLLLVVVPTSAAYEITAEPLGGEVVPFGLANSLTYDASPDGKAIQRYTFDLPTGTTINFTLWYGSGETVSGWMVYHNAGSFRQHTEVSIGGVVSGYDYTGLQEIGRIDIIGYARNKTGDDSYENGLIVYDSVFGLSDMKAVAFYPVGSSVSTIYKISWTSNNKLYSNAYVNTRSAVSSAASKSVIDVISEWVTFAVGMAGTIKDICFSIFYWLKFFFFDNLGMTVALYLSISLAYTACTSRNIFGFFKKFLNDQRKLFEFILSLWTFLINLIATFRSIFRV